MSKISKFLYNLIHDPIETLLLGNMRYQAPGTMVTINFVSDRRMFISDGVSFPESKINVDVLRSLELDYGWRIKPEPGIPTFCNDIKSALWMCVTRYHEKFLTEKVNAMMRPKEEVDVFIIEQRKILNAKLDIISKELP